MRLPRLSFDSLFARMALILMVNLILVQAVAVGLINLEIEAFDLGMQHLPERVADAIKQLDTVPAGSCTASGAALSAEGMTYAVHNDQMPPDISGGPGPGPGAGPAAGPPPGGGPAFDKERPMPFVMPNELSLYLKLHLNDYLPGGDRTVVVLAGRVGFHPEAGRPPFDEAGRAPMPPGDHGGPPAEPEPRAFHGGPRGPEAFAHVGVRLENGCWAEVTLHGPPPAFGWIRTLLHIGGFGLVIILCSLWFARGAARNLGQFSAAADAVGRSVDAPLLPETGPREVRLAARAFNQMQERLRRFVNDRTQMLAAISHDLRTPLTRLRLRAEFVDDDTQRAKILADIAEMEAMISATLAFARDDAVREPHTPQDVDQLLDQLASDLCDAGLPVIYEPGEPVTVACSPGGIRRALGNLAENAVKYGEVARLSLASDGEVATILIDDDGPGIAAEKLEQVFQPFFRLEGSRNRDTGGVGLGLSVARTIIRGHGGDVTLANRPEGGLRVTVTLPA